MTIEQFGKIIDYLIEIVLPPSNDPSVVAEQVIEILEDHITAISGTIIRHSREEK
jgi:hypothetical protein